ncbi:MAG: hypothetical protein ACO1NX_04885 [Chitinophagaceae bacterium]
MKQGNTATQKPARPRSLTILCLLSFIGTLVMLHGYINSYFDYKGMNAHFADAFLIMAFFKVAMLAGVVLMWLLRKAGFYLYLAGQSAALIYPFASGTADTVLGLLVLPVLIVSLLFIVLFARQWKHLY